MGEEEASTAMNAFLNEERLTSDVVIVKQMGNAGLDCKWLKVAADLSSVRSPNSYIQRMMRIATISVEDGLLVGDFITPDDVFGKEIFQRLVADAGGALNLVTKDLIKTYEEVRKKKEEKLRDILFATGSELSDFEDSNGLWAHRTMAPVVALVRQTFYGTSSVRTDPQIAEILETLPGNILREFQQATPASDINVNTQTIRSDLRDSINDAARRIANRKVQDVIKTTKQDYSNALYQSTIKDVYTDIYKRAGVPIPTTRTTLPAIDAIAILERIRLEAAKYEAEVNAQRHYA